MSDQKKHNPNPFIRMAQEAKDRAAAVPGAKTDLPQPKAPKPTKGYGGRVVRRSSRGG